MVTRGPLLPSVLAVAAARSQSTNCVMPPRYPRVLMATAARDRGGHTVQRELAEVRILRLVRHDRECEQPAVGVDREPGERGDPAEGAGLRPDHARGGLA